jgi:ATP-binding cassette subfamily B protein
MASHRLTFILAISLSFVGLVLQTLVPNMLNGAISHALVPHSNRLHADVVAILIVGLLAGIVGAVSRQYLFITAYNVEADLRSLIYEHLTWMSFSFYDRVQSGQLISRANSDIRSVQMYSTFAPLILVQCFVGVLAFGFMLSINPHADRIDRDANPLFRGHSNAPRYVPDLVDHPGSPRRRGDDR